MLNLIPTRDAVARNHTAGRWRVKFSSEILVKVRRIRTSTRAVFFSFIASEERIIKLTPRYFVLNIINTLSKNGEEGGKSIRKPASPWGRCRSAIDDQCMH